MVSHFLALLKRVTLRALPQNLVRMRETMGLMGGCIQTSKLSGSQEITPRLANEGNENLYPVQDSDFIHPYGAAYVPSFCTLWTGRDFAASGRSYFRASLEDNDY